MTRSKFWQAALCAGLVALGAGAANADYSKGQAAWDAGRYSEALKQWQAAARARDGRAMLALGRAYAKGLGVPQDYVEAHKWLNLAAGTGSAKAAAERDALAGKMTADERAEARKLARAWWLNREKAVRKAAAESGTPAAPAAKSDPKMTGSGDKPKAGGDDAAAKPEEPVSPSDIREAQKLLAALGYAPGPADGQWGPRSGRAYGAFLRDVGLPAAKGLTAPGLIELRATAKRRKGVAEKRRKETGKKKKAAAAPREPDEDRSVGVQSGQTAGQAIAKVARLAIQMAHAAILVRMANNPDKFGDVTPELRALLSKMVSGLSESDLSDTGDATVSLAALSPTERGRMSELLKRDKALPAKTRTALSKALQTPAASQKVAASRAASGPSCAGAAKGAKCWNKVTNKPGCFIFDPYYDPPETATWSGACSGGVAVGRGTWEWKTARSTGKATGTLDRGKLQGRWVFRYANGTVDEGTYVDGAAHGRWIIRYANGTVAEGPYVNGKEQGRWVIRFTSGRVNQGPYMNGKMHGYWVDRYPRGEVYEHTYVAGKKHGPAVVRYPNSISKGSYANGKKHGRWLYRSGWGTREGTYVNGKKNGEWVERRGDGRIAKGPYVNGIKQGFWVMRHRSGSYAEGTYVNGRPHGRWKESNSDQTREGTYANGKKNGHWIERYAHGRIEEGTYLNGKRHGKWTDRHLRGPSAGLFIEGHYANGRPQWSLRRHKDGYCVRYDYSPGGTKVRSYKC